VYLIEEECPLKAPEFTGKKGGCHYLVLGRGSERESAEDVRGDAFKYLSFGESGMTRNDPNNAEGAGAFT